MMSEKLLFTTFLALFGKKNIFFCLNNQKSSYLCTLKY
jgi:hypothetical protein